MRVLIFIILTVFHTGGAIAQQNDKPSWTQPMPELEETPEIDINNNLDTDIDLGFSRQKTIETDISRDEISLTGEQSAEEPKQSEEKRQKHIAEPPEQEAAVGKIAVIIEENKSDAEQNSAILKTAEVAEKPTVVEDKQVKYSWKKIKDESPQYPQRAYKNHREGWVDVQLTINAEGEVIDTVAVASYNDQSLFNRSALNAVRKWKYDPPRSYGIEEPLTTQVRINFKL